MIKINYRSIYNIAQLNTIDVTSPLYHLKFIFQSPITLHMNHTLGLRRNNNNQFHNKTISRRYATIILRLKPICNVVPCQ